MSLLGRKLRRDARKRWAQLAALALTLALGVAVFGAAFDAYNNLKTSYDEVYDRLNFADATVTTTSGLTPLVEELGQIDGVAAVGSRPQGDVPFRIQTEEGEQTLLGRVVGQPPDAQVNQLLIEEGQAPGGGGDADGGPVPVAIERHMADHFKLGVGDRLEVFGPDGWERAEITGVAVSPEYLWPARNRQDILSSPDDFGVLFASPDTAERLAGDAVEQQALVVYEDGADRRRTDRTVREVSNAAGASDILPRADQPSHAALQQDVEAFGELAILFPMLFLGAGALTTYVLLGRIVRSQRAELGMLAANGYPRRRILRHYLAFGAAVGAAGSAAGAIGGLLLAQSLTNTYTSALSIPLTVTRLNPLTPLIGLAAGTLAGMVAATGPARAATRVSPAEAMRGVAPVGVARRSLVERLPGLRALPVRIRMVVRNGARSPRRSLATGFGVVLASVLVLSSMGLLDTVEIIIDEQYQQIQREDAQVYLSPSRADSSPDQRADEVSSIPGVATAESALQVPVSVSAGDNRYQTALQGFEPGTTMHEFPGGLPRSGVLLAQALSGILKVETGDTVQLAAGSQAPVSVEVAGFVDEPIGSFAYASLDQAEQLAGDGALSSLLVRYEPGADNDDLRQQLSGLPGVVAVRDVRAAEETVRELMGLFYAIVGVMLVFGSILAFVVMANMLAVNLSERTVELGALRAAGARATTLARLVTGENVLLVAVAIPLGLLAGWVVADQLLASFNTDLWNFSLRLRTTTPLLVAGALVLITLVGYLPTRRALRRLAIAKIVRERAL